MTRDQRDDERLLEDWRSGDGKAGEALVSRHYEAIARFFIYRLGPDTEDLVQETFMGLQRGLERFRGDCSVRIYLYKIARYQLLNALRDRARDRARFDPSEQTMEALDPSASALIAAGDEHKLLVASLRRLPVDVQMMLELHYWERLKLHDIAEVLEMNLNTVKARMRRGRRRLHEEMERLAESDEQLRTTLNQIADWVAELREKIGEG